MKRFFDDLKEMYFVNPFALGFWFGLVLMLMSYMTGVWLGINIGRL